MHTYDRRAEESVWVENRTVVGTWRVTIEWIRSEYNKMVRWNHYFVKIKIVTVTVFYEVHKAFPELLIVSSGQFRKLHVAYLFIIMQIVCNIGRKQIENHIILKKILCWVKEGKHQKLYIEQFSPMWCSLKWTIHVEGRCVRPMG